MMKPRKLRSDCWGRCVWVGSLLFAGFCFWQAAVPLAMSRTTPEQAVSTPPVTHATKPIEEIRVGDRVMTELPKEAREADRPHSLASYQAVDPNTWRLIRLKAETKWDDGTVDDINIETLQPPVWLDYYAVEIGKLVPIPLDLVEMGLPKGLTAIVVALERCPPIAEGPGSLVLTTVNYLNPYVFDLTFVDVRGQTETVSVTGSHRVYSETRGAWQTVDELVRDEALNGLRGKLTVLQVQRRRGTERVYNLTVEGEHVYRVSAAGALVHNNCFIDAEALVAKKGGGILVIEPGDIPTGVWTDELPPLPGIPRTGPVIQHAFHVLDGIITDVGNPTGIPIDDWLEAFANINGGPDVIDEVIFRPHWPGGSQLPTHRFLPAPHPSVPAGRTNLPRTD